jgi:hypothetical protein
VEPSCVNVSKFFVGYCTFLSCKNTACPHCFTDTSFLYYYVKVSQMLIEDFLANSIYFCPGIVKVNPVESLTG